MMRKSIQRITAFIMAILMVLTMSNWSGLITVAKADGTTRIYFYTSSGHTYAYLFDNVDNASVEALGRWPGTAGTADSELGSGWYYVDVDSTNMSATTKLITNNGSGGSGNQDDEVTLGLKPYYVVKDGVATGYTTDAKARNAAATGAVDASAGFIGSSSANVLYCYVPITGNTFTLQYRTAANGGDNIEATGAAIEGCPGWYRIEINNPIGFVQFRGTEESSYVKDFHDVGITASSGSLKVLVGTNNLTEQYTNGDDAVAALELIAGYPGNPYPDPINVWYYNPDWTGVSDVKLIYKSDLTGEKTISTDQVTSFGSSMPGWFYVNGATAGVYAYRSTDNNISQIGFNGSDGVVGKKYSSDNNNVKNATTDLYLTETGAYTSLDDLITAESPAVSPKSPAKIYAYSSKTLTDAEVVAGDLSATVALGGELNQYIATIDKNPAVESYTASVTATGVNLSLNLTDVNTYINLDTGVTYDSWEDLVAGLSSTLTFTNGTAENVKVSVPAMNYETGNVETNTISLGSVAADTAQTIGADGAKGYTVSFEYDGTSYTQRVLSRNTTIDLENIQTTLTVYYYNGTTESNETKSIADKYTTRWDSVRAYVYYYPTGTANKTVLQPWAECTYEGDGWWSYDTGISANADGLENGIFVQFKDGSNGDNATKSFQFLNDYRIYATNMMTIHKSKAAAEQALRERGNGGSLPADSTTPTVWFYQSNWNASGITVKGYDGSSWNYSSTMTRDQSLVNDVGYWYHAQLPEGIQKIQFTDGTNSTEEYDISGNVAGEIFCAQSKKVISTGWSTSPAEIVKYYGLVNAPSTNEISLPLTLLDYNKDDLFFEYDANKLRSMTFVLGNKGQTGNIGVGNVYVDNAYIIDEAGKRPGNVPYLDRNRNEYVTGILEPELVNGNPVYTKQAIIYVAKVIEAYCNQANIQEGKSSIFRAVQPAIWNYKVNKGPITDWEEAYAATVEKFKAIDLTTWDVTDQNHEENGYLSPVDYAYYVMNNFYNPNSSFNEKDDTYRYLVLKKTSPNVYGFYGNYSTNKTADELEQKYNVTYNSDTQKIYNSDNGVDRGGFFPLDGKAWNESINNHNYHYSMKASGKFVFNDAKDLYFTFTGDDDVVLYINGKVALDLSGAHRSASYTIYLSDLKDQFGLVDDAYYDFDFFYMERHTDYANLRVETNIEVVDVAGKVQKYAYDTDEGNQTTRIPTGAYRSENQLVIYEFELTAPSKEDGLKELTFTDPSLGIKLTKDDIKLGSYVDAVGNTVDRNITDIYVSVGTTVYPAGSITRVEQLQEILEKGIASSERITIGGFKHVLHEGISGTVTATGVGQRSGNEITTEDSHTININKPSISLSKSAVDSTGNNLPDGSVLQAGETATYTITAKNTGDAALINMKITDEDLGFSMGLDENGKGTLKVNEYTNPADLVFTVTGTGVTDGIYRITPSTSTDPEADNKAAVERLIENLAKIAYPTSAAISVSGIKHPIVSTFQTEAEGTATPIRYINSTLIRKIENYIVAYEDAVRNGTTLPEFSQYVDMSEIIEASARNAVTAYKNAYEAYVREGKTPYEASTVPTADSEAIGFTVGDPVKDTADLTLSAKKSAYNYYSQTGQKITIDLGGEQVVELGKQTSVGSKEIGTVTLTEGAHTIDVYLKEKTGNDSVNLYQIVLTDTKDSSRTYTLDRTSSPRYLTSDGDEIGTYEAGSTSGTAGDHALVLQNVGDSVLCSIDNVPAGIYKVTVNYVAADNAVTIGLVTDREPGNSILTNAGGTELPKNDSGAYVIDSSKNVTATVDNSGIFSTVTYTNGGTGVEVFGIKSASASAEARPNTITVTTYNVNDDVYVLDYGLDVSLTDTAYNNGLFQNDQLQIDTSKEAVTFSGVKEATNKLVRDNAYAYQYQNTTYAETATGAYGKLEAADVNGLATKVTYSLNWFLEGIDRYTYAVQAGLKDIAANQKNVENSTPVMEANVTIMPASIVYYEDNFTSVMTNGTTYAEDGSKVERSTATDRQQGNGLTTQYGYDQAYSADNAYSAGGYTALAGNQSIAFTFQGTGFDILTRTDNANLYVAVYKENQYELKRYIYNGDKTMLYAKKKTDNASGPVKTAYVNAYNENQDIYQIPLISMDLGEFDTYLVVATKRTGSDNLNVDGLRIYNPLGGAKTTNAEVVDAYNNAEGEKDATVQDVRTMILGEGYTYNMERPAAPVTGGTNIKAGLAKYKDNKLYIAQGSTVVESYTGTIDSGSIAQDDRGDAADQTASLLAYAISGPNNELYLTGENYVFATVLKNVAEGATLQIGMKAVEGAAKVEYLNAERQWTALKDAAKITTATEMYYKVEIDKLWTSETDYKVLILRAVNAEASGNYILSMTNLKSSGITFGAPTANDLGNAVSEDKAESGAFEIMSTTVGSKKIVLTFAVSDQVKDFAVIAADEAGNSEREPLFTWDSKNDVTNGTVEGVTVKQRVAANAKIYVVSLPKSVAAGHYKLYVTTDDSYAPTEFDIVKNDDGE